MNTDQNRSVVSAQFLRGAVVDIRRVLDGVTLPVGNGWAILAAAIAKIEAVAEESERVATHPVRLFPIQDGPNIPWLAIEPFEKQAQQNHGGQTLERLAERGGLGVVEALCVLTCAPLFREQFTAFAALPKRDAILMLQSLVTTLPATAPNSEVQSRG